MEQGRGEAMSEQDEWYKKHCQAIRDSACKKCGSDEGFESAGTCSDGCCDRWKCKNCGHSFLNELG